MSNVIPFPARTVKSANEALLSAILEVERARVAFAAFKLAQGLREVMRNGSALAELYEAENEQTACIVRDVTKDAVRHYTAMAAEIQSTMIDAVSSMQSTSTHK